VLEAFEAEGADAWYKPGAKARFLGNDHDPEAYEQVFDILDVWFDSGSTHAFVLRDRPDGTEDGIADVYMEGTDQHRGWFHSSLLQACGTIGRAPYRNVVTHGFTLDDKGMKMSKSLGKHRRPAGGRGPVRRGYPAALGGAGRLHRGSADRAGDPERHRRQLPPAAQHDALHAGLAGRISPRPTGWRPSDMPELERWVLHRLAELDGGGARGLPRLRLPGRVPGGVPVRHHGPVGLLFRHPQGRACIATATPSGGARRGRCWISCSTG
jgi:isoleucyl-tRNA synthetase